MNDVRRPAPLTPHAPPPPIWHAQMRTPTCRYGHVQIDVRDAEQIRDYRVDGHLWQTCRRCSPSTYAFGVLTRFHRMVTFYAITQEQLREALGWPDDVETLDVLRSLGYGGADAA